MGRRKKTGYRHHIAPESPKTHPPRLPAALPATAPEGFAVPEKKIPKVALELGDSPPPMICQARYLILNAAMTAPEGGAQGDLRLAIDLIDAIIERYPELTAKQGTIR